MKVRSRNRESESLEPTGCAHAPVEKQDQHAPIAGVNVMIVRMLRYDPMLKLSS